MRLLPVWACCLLLAACAYDPIDKPGTWQVPPMGLTSNDQNLRAMVVNPRDLARGHGESTSEGVSAARAARQQLSGNRAALPTANVSLPGMGGGSGGQQQQQQPQGAGAGSSGRAE